MRTFAHAAVLPAALDFATALLRSRALGFSAVEVVALAERPPEHYEALAESGLLVACAVVGFGLPEGQSLDAPSVEGRRAAVDLLKRHLADAATLGATRAYLVPGTDTDPGALRRFAEGCGLLATYAAQRMIGLCLKPVTGRALTGAAAALDWLEATGLDGVNLLLNTGTGLSSAELAAVVRRAGRRLGHIHLPAPVGTEAAPGPLFAALEEMHYNGFLAVPLAE